MKQTMPKMAIFLDSRLEIWSSWSRWLKISEWKASLISKSSNFSDKTNYLVKFVSFQFEAFFLRGKKKKRSKIFPHLVKVEKKSTDGLGNKKHDPIWLVLWWLKPQKKSWTFFLSPLLLFVFKALHCSRLTENPSRTCYTPWRKVTPTFLGVCFCFVVNKDNDQENNTGFKHQKSLQDSLPHHKSSRQSLWRSGQPGSRSVGFPPWENPTREGAGPDDFPDWNGHGVFIKWEEDFWSLNTCYYQKVLHRNALVFCGLARAAKTESRLSLDAPLFESRIASLAHQTC